MNKPETKSESNWRPLTFGFQFVDATSKKEIPLPPGWKTETRSKFFKIAISPEGKPYWIEYAVNGFNLLEYKIATKDDVKNTNGRLKIGKAFIGDKLMELKKPLVEISTLESEPQKNDEPQT